MTDYREIERLRKNPRQVLALAKWLRDQVDKDARSWAPREIDFLDDLIERKVPRVIADSFEMLTTRQIEWLINIRDGAKHHATTSTGNFSVKLINEQCWLARLELDNDREIGFLDDIKGRETMTTKQLGWLLHIARKLQVIEEYV